MVRVQTGVSDGTNIEIISGLSEGDEIIYIASTATGTTGFMMGGMSGMGGMPRGMSGGMGGGMPQREQMQRGERPQGRPDGERRRPNVMAMFDEGNLKELDKIYAQSDKKIEALLTPEQLLKWREQAGMNVAERENRISQILSIVTGRGGRDNRGGFGGFGGGMGGPMGGPGGPR